MEYLRDYQTETMNAVTRELNHVQSTLFVMPTGTGKTETFLSIADQWPQGKVLVIAHREELIWQPFHRWKDRTGDYGEVEMADYRGRTGHRRGKITFASKDSLHPKRLAQAFPDPNDVWARPMLEFSLPDLLGEMFNHLSVQLGGFLPDHWLDKAVEQPLDPLKQSKHGIGASVLTGRLPSRVFDGVGYYTVTVLRQIPANLSIRPDC